MSAVYSYMGEFDRFEQAMSRFEHSYPDTINPNYVICLEQRCNAAQMQGRTDEALPGSESRPADLGGSFGFVEGAHRRGFPSADTFGRNFKHKYTLTPTQFREEHSEMR